MAEAIDYSALLETYRKQELLLEEKSLEYEKIFSEYQEAEKRHREIQNQISDADAKVMQKKLKFLENMQGILNTCQESGLTIGELRTREEHLRKLRETETEKLKNLTGMVKGVSEDLTQVDVEFQLDALTNEITDYENKMTITSEINYDLSKEHEELLKKYLPEYDIPPVINGINDNVNRNESLKDLNNEIGQIKKNLKKIEVETQEMKKKM